MKCDIEVVAVRQVDGVRYLALSGADSRAIRRDRAMLDCVKALACLDVDALGRAVWAHPFGCADTAAGRAAIRKHRASEGVL